MTKQMSTLALMAALVAVAFASLPSQALAQHGHHYGHGYGGYGYGGYDPYGYGAYRSNYGDVRIEVSPKYLRDEAQVYVDEAHVGDVDDFDGFLQRLTLTPGEYDMKSGSRAIRP